MADRETFCKIFVFALMAFQLRFVPVLAIIASVAICGCATTRPSYSPPSSGAVATVKGRSANLIKFFSDGDSHVSIVEIDGLYLPPSFWTGNIRSVKVAPGSRRVTVLLSGNNYTQAQETISIEAVAGHSYQIEAKKVGIAFDLVVYDEGTSGADRNTVLSARIGGSTGRGPAYVPIFIPTK